jgi:hypothetical protein
MLPPKVPRKPKRASRWRSQAHMSFVRGHACAFCGETTNVHAAHVRNGSAAGIGQKPDDWRAVSLCGGDFEHRGCHGLQHAMGEQSFWRRYREVVGQSVDDLIASFIKASPKRREIEEAMKERGL